MYRHIISHREQNFDLSQVRVTEHFLEMKVYMKQTTIETSCLALNLVKLEKVFLRKNIVAVSFFPKLYYTHILNIDLQCTCISFPLNEIIQA